VGQRVCRQDFEARVADVHQLLIKRAVHVGFVGAHLQGAYTERNDVGQARVIGRESALHLKRVAGLADIQLFERERFGAGHDHDLNEPPALPPERFVRSMFAALKPELVADAVAVMPDRIEIFAFYFIAIAFIHRVGRGEERFLPVDANAAFCASGRCELWIGAHIVVQVEQYAAARSGWNRERGAPVDKILPGARFVGQAVGG